MSIYTAAPVERITFTIGDPDLEQPLGSGQGFQAAHVRVNNPTNQAIYFPDAGDFVPAGVSGAVLGLSHTDVARASWTIPGRFGLVQPPPLNGAAQLIFLSKNIDITPQAGTAANPTPPFPGSTVPTSAQVAAAVAAGANPFLNQSVPMPAGAKLQLIGTGFHFPFVAVPLVTATGDQTGFPYFSGPLSGTVNLTIQPADTSVTVIAEGAAGVTLTVNTVLNAILISGSPSGAPASWPGRYDGQVTAAPSAGTKATVTLAANPTRRWVADSFRLGAINTTAAATMLTTGSLIDGVSGGAAKLHRVTGALPAAIGDIDRGVPSGARYANAAVNTAMTCEWDTAPAATIQQVANLGAYLQ